MTNHLTKRIIAIFSYIIFSSLSPQAIIRNIYSHTLNIGSIVCLFYLSTSNINVFDIKIIRSPALYLYFCDNISFDLYFSIRIPHLSKSDYKFLIFFAKLFFHCNILIGREIKLFIIIYKISKRLNAEITNLQQISPRRFDLFNFI
jgi:hypothetical protein